MVTAATTEAVATQVAGPLAMAAGIQTPKSSDLNVKSQEVTIKQHRQLLCQLLYLLLLVLP